MSDRAHISKINAQRFEEAVRSTLARMLEADVPFSVNAVICASTYSDGSRVGEATIYAKASHGGYVHATLLRDLKKAALRSRRRRSRVRVGNAAGAANRGDIQQLERTPALERQLLEQENRLNELESAIAAAAHQTALQRQELYVALAVLNRLARGKVLQVLRALQEVKQGLSSPEAVRAGDAQVQEIEEQCRNAILDI